MTVIYALNIARERGIEHIHTHHLQISMDLTMTTVASNVPIINILYNNYNNNYAYKFILMSFS